MGKISFLKGGSVKEEFIGEISRQPLMPEANDEAKLYRCVLKKGCRWQAPLYSFQEKIQMFFFISGNGYVAAKTQCWQINEQALFVPEFDKEDFFIQAGDTDLHFLHITGDLNDYDRQTMGNWCIKLPRFRTYSQCVEYTEGFSGDAGSNVKSRLLIEGRGCGRWSMGWNDGVGPNFIGQHIHPFLEQWYYVLPDGSFTYIAGGDEVKMEAGDLSYTQKNTSHGSKSEPGQKINYIWLELASDGYPVGRDGLPGLL